MAHLPSILFQPGGTLQIPTPAGQEVFPCRLEPTSTDCCRRAAGTGESGVWSVSRLVLSWHLSPGASRRYIWNQFETRERRNRLKDRVSRQKTHQQPQSFKDSDCYSHVSASHLRFILEVPQIPSVEFTWPCKRWLELISLVFLI